jgi:hypothetical protein
MVKSCPAPPCLSRAAVELVQDALAKGCVRLLARKDGWRHERYWRGERLMEGRLWERTPPAELGLTFSRHTLEFLLWMTAANLSDKEARWEVSPGAFTLGDRLLLFFAYETVRPTPLAEVLQNQAPFAQHGLCRLAFPEDFGDNAGRTAPAWTPWISGTGACILEALRSQLVERWRTVERDKGRIKDGRRMLTLGQVQENVLNTFLEAIDAAGRRDLARFLLQVLAGLLENAPVAADWVGNLDLKGLRLADRADIYRAAVAVLRCLDRLQQWDQEARTIGYFDDGYVAGQMWKAEWEHWGGDTLHARAQAILRELEPLRT